MGGRKEYIRKGEGREEKSGERRGREKGRESGSDVRVFSSRFRSRLSEEPGKDCMLACLQKVLNILCE